MSFPQIPANSHPDRQIINVDEGGQFNIYSEFDQFNQETHKYSFEQCVAIMRFIEQERLSSLEQYNQTLPNTSDTTLVQRSNQAQDPSGTNAVVLEGFQTAVWIASSAAEVGRDGTLSFSSTSTVDSINKAFRFAIDDIRAGRNSLNLKIPVGFEGGYFTLLTDQRSDFLIESIATYLQKTIPTEELFKEGFRNFRTSRWYKSLWVDLFRSGASRNDIIREIGNLKRNGVTQKGIEAVLLLSGKYSVSEATTLYNAREL